MSILECFEKRYRRHGGIAVCRPSTVPVDLASAGVKWPRGIPVVTSQSRAEGIHGALNRRRISPCARKGGQRPPRPA